MTSSARRIANVHFRFPAAAAILLLSTIASQAAVTYTPTTGPSCRDFSKPEFGDWACPGPGGYVARFTDEGNLVSVSIGHRSRTKEALTTQFRGAGKVFGDKIEWHVVDGVPKSAILRMWHLDENEKELQTLEVFLFEPHRACSFGSVDARRSDANELASQRAEYATHSNCSDK
jgi:hypothetical protein